MSARDLAVARIEETAELSPEPRRREPRPERTPDRPIGAVLRDRRVGRNEDAQQVAHKLCLTRDYLFALEEGRYDRLPAACYTVGYARAYAQHLGLDADDVAGRVKQELANAGRAEEMTLPEGEAVRRGHRALRRTSSITVGIMLVGVFALASAAAFAAVAIL